MSIASKIAKAAKKSAKAAEDAAKDAAKSAKVTKVAATGAAALGGAGVVYTGLKHINGVVNGGNNNGGDPDTKKSDDTQREDTYIIDGSGKEGGGTYYVGGDGYGEPNSAASITDTLFKYLPFIIGGIIIIALFALPTKSEKKKKRGASS